MDQGQGERGVTGAEFLSFVSAAGLACRQRMDRLRADMATLVPEPERSAVLARLRKGEDELGERMADWAGESMVGLFGAGEAEARAAFLSRYRGA